MTAKAGLAARRSKEIQDLARDLSIELTFGRSPIDDSSDEESSEESRESANMLTGVRFCTMKCVACDDGFYGKVRGTDLTCRHDERYQMLINIFERIDGKAANDQIGAAIGVINENGE